MKKVQILKTTLYFILTFGFSEMKSCSTTAWIFWEDEEEEDREDFEVMEDVIKLEASGKFSFTFSVKGPISASWKSSNSTGLEIEKN